MPHASTRPIKKLGKYLVSGKCTLGVDLTKNNKTKRITTEIVIKRK